MEIKIEQNLTNDFSSSVPLILLATDKPRLIAPLCRSLEQEGLSVHLAPGYRELEPLSQEHGAAIVLLEVSHEQSVEAAVDLALRVKRRNSRRFVGYLADPILYTSGLAGDAIFPRDARQLSEALRDYFKGCE
jgi:hypothetical protein